MKKLIQIISGFILLSIFTSYTYSQNLPTWQRAYRDLTVSPPESIGHDAIQLNDGSFLVIALRASGWIPDTTLKNKFFSNIKFPSKWIYVPNCAFILKLNSYGDVIDTTHISRYLPYTCAKTLDDGCIFMGSIDTISSDEMHATKINSSGKLIWKRIYSNTASSQCIRMIRTSDNKFLGCGNVNYIDSYIIKIDSNGNRLWQKNYTKGFRNQYYALCESTNKNYIAIGNYSHTETSPIIGYITKFDTSGNILSEKEYRYNNQPFMINAIGKMSAKYLLSGEYYDTLACKSFVAFLIINESGEVLSQKSFPGYPDLSVVNADCQIINENKFLLLNRKYRSSAPTYDNSYVQIVDSSGNILNTQIYGNVEIVLTKANKIQNGQFLFIGASGTYNEWQPDIFVVRADSNLYATPCKIENNVTQIPEKYLILDASPNPFNSSTKIKYSIPEKDLYSMQVFNILGQKVKDIFSENLNAGEYTKMLDFSDFASGMYFVKLSSTKSQITKKIALIK